MFPKFLRVASFGGQKEKVWVNETTFVEKIVPHFKDGKIWNMYAEALGFSYEFVLPSDGAGYGMLHTNGSFTGSLGMLQRGEIDMVIGDLVIDEKLSEEFRLSFPSLMSVITFMTRKHEYVPDSAVYLHPFSIPVWLSIVACIFLMSFLFRNLLRKKHHATDLMTSTLGSLVGQGLDLIPRRPREYLLLASWILSSGLLSYFYAAVLLSFLTFPSLHGIRTIGDLANGIENGKYQSFTYPQASYAFYLSESENPASRVIGNNLKDCENENNIDCLENFSEGNKKPAFVGVWREFEDENYKDHYFVSEENLLFLSSAYAMRKDFCCREELDKVILRAWASELFQKWMRYVSYYYFLENSKMYGDYWENNRGEVKLTMTVLKGPFIFLIVSHSLSILVFLIEVCIGKFKRH